MNNGADRLSGLSPQKRALLARRLAEKAAPAATPTVERIAVVAAACRLPGGADSPQALWQLLVEARDAVGDVPPQRWDGDALFDAEPQAAQRIRSRQGAFLDGVDRFDAGFFGISPREAAQMDPQQRLLLEMACEALDAAGLPLESLAGSATGVFVGAHSQSSDYWLLQLAQRDGVESHSATGSAHSILANRVSYALDLHGPSMTIDTACSSSLVAVHLACQSLRSGECDLALAGGVNLLLLPGASFAFSQLQILSPRGRCRSFDAEADGIVRGEGGGLVVLKRLSDAQRDGDPVLALIAGSAVNQDGASNGLTAPSGAAQEAVVRRALAMAGVGAERVGLVETHGTGTPLGDPVEVEALSCVIGPARDAAHRCVLGALKTNIGHLEAAAGIAGLIKAVECVRRGEVPANLHFTRPNPHLALHGTPFVIPTRQMAWPATALPRIAGVSSFGFGGTNAHVVLEEHRELPVASAPTASALEWLTVSARDRDALAQSLRAHAALLNSLPPGALSDVAYATKLRRSHHAWRVAVAGSSPEEIARQLLARADAPLRRDAPATQGPVVWVFGGQGGVWAGMGRELYDSEAVFRAALDEVAEAFLRQSGHDPRPAVLDASKAAALDDTEVAQPALFALQVALAALWRSRGVEPGAVLGHSVGEVAAAHAARVLSLDDAVTVVTARSRAMRGARGRGCMAQVECDEAALHQELTQAAGQLSVAARNGPASTVLAGDVTAMTATLARLDAQGIHVRKLPLDYAFHSAQMDGLLPDLVRSLAALRPRRAELPMASTVSGAWWADGDGDAAYWGRNVRQTVRFADAITLLLEAGFSRFLEIGPHPALGSGVQGCADAAGVEVTVAGSLRRAQPSNASLLSAQCALYEGGAEIRWQLLRDRRRRWPALPPYPWQRQRHWLGEPDAAALAFNVTGRRAALTDTGGTACYALDWPAVPGASTPPSFDLAAAAAGLARQAARLPDASLLAGEAPVQAALERRGAELAWQAVRALLPDTTPGARVSGAAAAHGLAPQRQRLWQRLLQLAQQSGWLEQDGDDWRITTAGAGAAPAGPLAMPRAEAVLMERCGAALSAVLRGEADPLGLLFPADGHDSASAVYAEAPSARVYNQLAAQAVEQLADQAGRPLRVLEIGAGTGSTTAAVLAVLPPGSRYCYTDVSPLFLQQARERLRSSALALEFRPLDIERPPQEQGFDGEDFDIVLGANVLHATRDLRSSLGHARSLLADGGALLLVETVARRAWADLSFGMTDGWWRFADAPLRRHDALLGAAPWVDLLAGEGFVEAQSVAESWSCDAVHPQALLLARRPARPAAAPRLTGTSWLVVGDRGGFGQRLAEAILAEGGRCAVIDATQAPALAAQALDGIVHCGLLDVAAAGDTSAETLSNDIPGAIAGAFAWARAATAGMPATRLRLVTRGAQPIHRQERPLAPAAATAWGLGRSMALERPDAWGGLIDLDPASGDAASIASLIEVLAERDGDDQQAVRAGRRHGARLMRREAPAPAALALDAGGAYLVTGGYGGLGPKLAHWLADQGARHVVLLGRRGPSADERIAGLARSLQSRGVVLHLERGDVADAVAMRALVDRLDREGRPLRGIVHAAASIRFASLEQLDASALDDAMRAKLRGSWVLHELSRDLPLDLFVLFSSGTSVFGASSLSAYAAANQCLAALAHHRAALGLPATCVDWGAWSEIRLLDDAPNGGIARYGWRPMRDDDALALLSGLVREQRPVTLVADIDWPVAIAAYQARGRRPFLDAIGAAAAATVPASPVSVSQDGDLHDELAGLATGARRDRLQALVRAEVAGVLGLPGAQAVDPSRGFFELGLDSLMAMQLRRRLTERLGVPLSTTATFNHPSVTALVEHLQPLLGAPPDGSAPQSKAAGPDAAQELSGLSDGDVHAALLAELAGLDDALGGDAAGRGSLP